MDRVRENQPSPWMTCTFEQDLPAWPLVDCLCFLYHVELISPAPLQPTKPFSCLTSPTSDTYFLLETDNRLFGSTFVNVWSAKSCLAVRPLHHPFSFRPLSPVLLYLQQRSLQPHIGIKLDFWLDRLILLGACREDMSCMR